MKKSVSVIIACCFGIIVLLVLAVSPIRNYLFGSLWGEPRYDGQPASYWVLKTYDHDSRTGANAQSALDAMGDDAWRKNVDNPNPRVRGWALHEEIIHTGDPDGKDPRTNDALVGLTALMSDPDADARTHAAYNVSLVGLSVFLGVPSHDAIAANLGKALLVEDPFIRDSATQLLVSSKVGSRGQAAVPACIEALKSKNTDTRRCAIIVLKGIGKPAKAAVPELIQVAKQDSNKALRSEAADAAKAIDAEQVARAGIK